MTAAVTQQAADPEKLAMTAPVLQQAADWCCQWLWPVVTVTMPLSPARMVCVSGS